MKTGTAEIILLKLLTCSTTWYDVKRGDFRYYMHKLSEYFEYTTYVPSAYKNERAFSTYLSHVRSASPSGGLALRYYTTSWFRHSYSQLGS